MMKYYFTKDTEIDRRFFQRTVYICNPKHGELAHLVERLHGMQEVTGSIPVFSTTALLAQIAEKFVKNFDKMKVIKTYEPATLLASKTSTWFVIWHNYNPETKKLERVRKTFDLNRIHDLKERKAKGLAVVETINEALINGYNYFTDQDDATGKSLPSLAKSWAQAYAVRIIGAGDDSVRGWGSICRIFICWAESNGLAEKPASAFKAAHFQSYVSHLASDGKSNTTINNHINVIASVFKRMHKPLAVIKENPLDGFRYLPKTESDLFEPLTEDELIEVATRLQKVNPHFYCYTQFIYYGYVRPKHIGLLKRQQVDFSNNTLNVRGSSTKSKRNAGNSFFCP